MPHSLRSLLFSNTTLEPRVCARVCMPGARARGQLVEADQRNQVYAVSLCALRVRLLCGRSHCFCTSPPLKHEEEHNNSLSTRMRRRAAAVGVGVRRAHLSAAGTVSLFIVDTVCLFMRSRRRREHGLGTPRAWGLPLYSHCECVRAKWRRTQRTLEILWPGVYVTAS